jgi:hypothetical protein
VRDERAGLWPIELRRNPRHDPCRHCRPVAATIVHLVGKSLGDVAHLEPCPFTVLRHVALSALAA